MEIASVNSLGYGENKNRYESKNSAHCLVALRIGFVGRLMIMLLWVISSVVL